MRLIVIFVFLSYGCSQVSRKENDDVSLNAALNQATASYLKGCVEAFKTTQVTHSFPECTKRARKHREEIESIMAQEIHDGKLH
jgi:hypothetical protein